MLTHGIAMQLKEKNKKTTEDTSNVMFETTLELIQDISVIICKANPVHKQDIGDVINVGCIVIHAILHLASKEQSSRFFMKLHMLSCIIMDWNFLKIYQMIHSVLGFVHPSQCTQRQINLITLE